MGLTFIAALGGAAAAATTAATTAFTAISGTTILGAIARIGIGIGLALLARQFQPKPKPTDGQTEVKQAVPPRTAHYGRVKTSGYVSFHEAVTPADLGTAFHTLFKDIVVSARRIDSFEAFYLQDREVSINEDNQVETKPYVITGQKKVRIFAYLGTDVQLSDQVLQDAFPDQWTADHRLLGIAHVVVEMQATSDPANFSKVYPGGEPILQVLIRGNQVYDPRKDSTIPGGSGTHRIDDPSTWEWSDNAGLCILDFLTHSDNYARPIESFLIGTFMLFADLCDEAVPLAAGGTEPRYRVAMSYEYTEPRKEVLRRLLDSCDAYIYRASDGRYGIRGGKWVEPTVTISHADHHILELELQEPDALDRYNEMVITFMSPAHGYVEQECDPWLDEADIAATGEIHSRAFDCTQVPSYTQARRLAKIRMARDNPRWNASVKTNFYGVNCIGEEIINLTFPQMLVDGPYWMIGGPQLAENFLSASLTLRSADETSYDWTTAEEGESPSVAPDTSEYVIAIDYSKGHNSFNFLLLLY